MPSVGMANPSGYRDARRAKRGGEKQRKAAGGDRTLSANFPAAKFSF